MSSKKEGRKFWSAFVVVAILSIAVIAALVIGILSYSNFTLLIQKVGFFASFAVLLGVIFARRVIRRYGYFPKNRMGYTILVILCLIALLLSGFTAIRGDLGTKSYYVDYANGVVYAEKNNEYVVEKVLNTRTDVTVNTMYDGKHVGKVSSWAARNNSSMVTLTIEGDGDLEIKKGAFKGCSRLAEVTFNSNNATYTIGKQAFASCHQLKDFTCGNTNELTVKKNAFKECPALTTFNVGSSTVIANTEHDWFTPIFGGGTKAVVHVDGGKISYLADSVGGLVIGNKSVVEISATENYNNKSLVFNAGTVVFVDGFDFNGSTFVLASVGTRMFKEVIFYHPFGDDIYLPASITYIPDNFFGDDGSACRVHFAGTQEQWNSLTIGSSGNSNYTDGKVNVEYNSSYGG